MTSYQTPAASVEVEYEIKKSRFIARAAPIGDRAEAMLCLETAKRDFPDARHHCWAYVLGNQHSAAMSDDGEPSGTAGKPILNVLQHKHIGDIMLVVIRYFGGVKLGAGGLVRAYSNAAQLAIDALPLTQHVSLSQVEVCCDFAHEQGVRHWAQSHDVLVKAVEYSQTVTMLLALPAERIPQLRAYCESVAARLRAIAPTVSM